MNSISDRYRNILDRIDRACLNCGRDPAGVTLIAVSKTQPVEAIKPLVDLGQLHFGESRLQEAEPKIAELPIHLEWHFIGTLQSNKAKRVASLFSTIHTFTNDSQLKEVAKGKRVVDGLIEVNIAEETQKAGIFAEGLDEYRANLIECNQVHFRGLMTIGPLVEDPEASRPYFRRLKELGMKLESEWLSMGMSHDFEVAIQEGATHVRVGTALFGAR